MSKKNKSAFNHFLLRRIHTKKKESILQQLTAVCVTVDNTTKSAVLNKKTGAGEAVVLVNSLERHGE